MYLTFMFARWHACWRRAADGAGDMSREVATLVVLTLLASILHGLMITDTRRRVNLKTKGSSELAKSLRKQLMINNYDYMSMETEEAFPPRRAHEEPPADTSQPDLEDIFIPHTFDDLDGDALSSSAADSDREISKNDLLYYVDNDRLKKNSIEMQQAFSFEHKSLDNTKTPKVKYKLIKMKVPGRSRRAGSGKPYRRFLQEEGEQGVVLINLGDEPFPEFRLPNARRQYMAADPDRNTDAELDIAPISEFSDEMQNRSDNF